MTQAGLTVPNKNVKMAQKRFPTTTMTIIVMNSESIFHHTSQMLKQGLLLYTTIPVISTVIARNRDSREICRKSVRQQGDTRTQEYVYKLTYALTN